MAGTGPGILPKTALVASRAIYYPFTIPQKVNDSMTLTGNTLNTLAKNVNQSFGAAYEALEPRGPAKWLVPLFHKVDAATDHSAAIGARNKVFWDPFTQGVESIGRGIASPGAYWYLKKAGMEAPTQDAIKGVLNMPFFSFPMSGGEAPAPEPEPAPAPAPAPDAPAPDAPAPDAPAPDAPAPDAPAPDGGGAPPAGVADAAGGAGEVTTTA